jgi:hypothetical protein
MNKHCDSCTCFGLEPEERPVELWRGERKVSIYRETVLRVWGPDMDTQMDEKPRTHESVTAAVDWLYSPETKEEKHD